MKTKHEGQGQSGSKLALTKDDLNKDEMKVYETLKRGTKGKTIADLADLFRGAKEKTNSRVRNALRRLVRSDLAKKVDRGTYVAGKGRSRGARSATRGGGKKAAAAKESAKGKAREPRTPRLVPPPLPAFEEINSKADSLGLALGGDEGCGHRILVAIHMLGAKDGKSSTKIAQAAGLSRGYVIRRLKKLGAIEESFFAATISKDLIESKASILATPRAA